MRYLKKYVIKELLIQTSWTTLIIGIICFLFYFLIDLSALGSLSDKNNDSDLVHLFYSIENQGDRMIPYDPDIVIVDISDCETLTEIATAIQKVGTYNPHSIVLDIIFRQTASVDTSEYNVLTTAIARTPQLITACRIIQKADTDEYEVEHSFFTKSLHIPYGAINRQLNGFTPFFVVNGDTIPSLPAMVAQGNVPKRKNRYINFSDKGFLTLLSKEEIFEDDLKDKIVIINDLKDARDHHDLPFYLNGSRRAPGAILLAYGISSVNRADWVKKMGWLGCVLLGLIITFLFTYLRFLMQHFNWKYLSLKTRILRVILLLLLLFAGYWIFSATGWVVNLLYAMFGIALSGLSMDIFDLIYTNISRFKKNKEEK